MKAIINKYIERIETLESENRRLKLELEKAQNALCDIDAIITVDNFSPERSFLETEKECRQIICKVLDL
jgi:hypothetical protein